MRHGLRYWEKRLRPTKELALKLRTSLVTQLVTLERLNLTKAKAEWVKHHVDLLIDVAKGPQSDDTLKFMIKNLDHTNLTLNKLCGPIAARYANIDGNYTRIIRYGPKGQGTNQAEMSYIELVGHKYDVRYALALDRMKKRKEIIKKLYEDNFKKEEISVLDPFTGKELKIVKYAFLDGIDNNKRLFVRRTFKSLFSDDKRENESIKFYNEARKAEAEHALKAREVFDTIYVHEHQFLQQEVDKELKKTGKVSDCLLNKIAIKRACLEGNKIVPQKWPQDIAYETGELPILYSMEEEEFHKIPSQKRRIEYYYDPKNVRKNSERKFNRSYLYKTYRFPLPPDSNIIPDKPSAPPPDKKRLSKEEFMQKYIDLATPRLIKQFNHRKSQGLNPIFKPRRKPKRLCKRKKMKG